MELEQSSHLDLPRTSIEQPCSGQAESENTAPYQVESIQLTVSNPVHVKTTGGKKTRVVPDTCAVWRAAPVILLLTVAVVMATIAGIIDEWTTYPPPRRPPPLNSTGQERLDLNIESPLTHGVKSQGNLKICFYSSVIEHHHIQEQFGIPDDATFPYCGKWDKIPASFWQYVASTTAMGIGLLEFLAMQWLLLKHGWQLYFGLLYGAFLVFMIISISFGAVLIAEWTHEVNRDMADLFEYFKQLQLEDEPRPGTFAGPSLYVFICAESFAIGGTVACLLLQRPGGVTRSSC